MRTKKKNDWIRFVRFEKYPNKRAYVLVEDHIFNESNSSLNDRICLYDLNQSWPQTLASDLVEK